ncbi:MAG TPA: iron-containing alcohol dehydrogenase [Bryobacteraceae bacterium]|nr:iron-containing alcohol dehydrogenase [Bryobacteraceae bacterium]
MTPFDFRPRTRVLFGAGDFSRLGEVARESGATKCLLVADRGMVERGYAQEATRTLKARRIEVCGFHDFEAGPTVPMIDVGAAFAGPLNVNLIVALGGGSSLDCAKAINFVITNGGSIRDYWGYGKASKPMLPMIAVPTTAGTGSEAQSTTVIVDPETSVRMACGDHKASFRAAILDPKLTVSQPRALTMASGWDAIAHAVETLVSTRQTALSECFSRSAWRLLNSNFERTIKDPSDLAARGGMLIGAHFGGLAVENSNLGAAHACAAPLTAHYKVPHGVAVGLMLAVVVEWNCPAAGRQYDELTPDLVRRLRDLADVSGLPQSLRDASIPEEALPRLAEEAASQWVGRFNPRAFDAAAALEIYRCAY